MDNELDLWCKAFRLAWSCTTDKIALALAQTEVDIGLRMPTIKEQQVLCIYKTALAYHLRGITMQEV